MRRATLTWSQPTRAMSACRVCQPLPSRIRFLAVYFIFMYRFPWASSWSI